MYSRARYRRARFSLKSHPPSRDSVVTHSRSIRRLSRRVIEIRVPSRSRYHCEQPPPARRARAITAPPLSTLFRVPALRTSTLRREDARRRACSVGIEPSTSPFNRPHLAFALDASLRRGEALLFFPKATAARGRDTARKQDIPAAHAIIHLRRTTADVVHPSSLAPYFPPPPCPGENTLALLLRTSARM